MGNCLSKCGNEMVTFYTPPINSGHLKKAVSRMYEHHINFFTTAIKLVPYRNLKVVL